MIRKLTVADADNVLQYLTADHDYNAFMIGDIINYGYDSDSVEVWGQFSAADTLDAVLLRYDNFFLFSTQPPGRDWRAFLPLITSYLKLESISGRPQTIEPLANILQRECCVKTYMQLGVLSSIQPRLTEVELATTGDAALIDALLVSVEFGFLPGEIIERYQRTVERGEARYFVVRRDGKIVACAATAAECAQSAVIVSVCCRPEYRRRGYAEACMYKLCTTLVAEGKQLYLFYENPAAGKLYEQLGFVAIGEWAMIEMEMN